jgi:hypothetical protein
MRKIVILLVLILSIVCCYYVSVEGVDAKFIQIASYEDVKSANKQLDTQISELNRKNTTEYESKKTALTTAVKSYKDKKEQYEALAPTISTDTENTEEITDSAMPYDVEFLWTIVGNYATEEGIKITFTFTKSASSITTNSDYYTMADINFSISGTYNSIIEFIYDIEDDDRLGFEISNFKMTSGQATFTVKSVPITSENITSLDSSTTGTISSTGTTSTDGTAIDNTTTDGTTVDGTIIDDTSASTSNLSTGASSVSNTTIQ